MRIGPVDTADRVLVIAEIGNNHEGDVELAEELVRLAAAAGAGAVKFQAIVPDRLVSAADTARVAQLERFRLDSDDFAALAEVAAAEGVGFLCTPFDLDSVLMLDPLVPAFKVASGDNTFTPLLEAVAATGKPIVLSAGLADLAEIGEARDTIRSVWSSSGVDQELALLHCVVSYPTPPDQANLQAIRTLAKLGETVGYSDHTIGIDAAVLSVALGARIVEKHFTIAKDHSDFRDHQLSADPADLAAMVRRIREAEILLGTGEKRMQPAEAEAAVKARRSVVAAHDLEAGRVIAWEDLDWVRPGGGVAPGDEGVLIGRALRRPVARGTMLRPEDLA